MNNISQAIKDLSSGKMIILTDDENRENEGDLVLLGDFVTPEAINFMATFGKGLICAPVSNTVANTLGLHQMVRLNTDSHSTAFTVSIDHESSTTGISAHERAKTIKELTQSNNPSSFKRPGHIFPLVAKEGGVLTRMGHTEASIDLAKLANTSEVAVICEIMNDDGTMARMTDLKKFSLKHGINMYTIKDLKDYILHNALTKISAASMPTKHGDFTIISYQNNNTGKDHVALIKGEPKEHMLTRIHSECFTGDILGSHRCDCGNQLEKAMDLINKKGSGIIVYLRQEGRGIGLPNKIKSYHLQDEGLDTVDANLALGFKEDERDYLDAVMIYKDLGIESVDLLTNNQDKIDQLEQYGIKVSKRVSIETEYHEHSMKYMKTKKERMNHKITL